MIKICFFDVDGTIISTHTKKMTPKMKECLLSLQNNGIKIGLATGRGPSELPNIEGITFDAYVTFNGAYCYVGDVITNDDPFSKADLYTLLSNLDKIPRKVCAASVTTLMANGTDEDLTDYFHIVNKEVPVNDKFDEFIKNDKIYQLMLKFTKGEDDKVLEGTKNVNITTWWSRATDIVPASSGKGRGVMSVINYLGIKPEEVLVFGDGGNDLEMFTMLPNGIAMGNASKEIKDVSIEVIDTVENDGIYKFCKNQKLI